MKIQMLIELQSILTKNYFLPRIKIENYNIEIDGRNFLINQLMIQLNNMMKLEKNQQNKVMII